MSENPEDTGKRAESCCSHAEQEVALHALHYLIERIGDPATMTADLWQIHRVIIMMKGIIVEVDRRLSSGDNLEKTVDALAQLIATEAKYARHFRTRNGIGLMDLVLQIDPDTH